MRAKWLPLSKPRRLVCDLLHFAASVPSVPVQRRMSLGCLVEARDAMGSRPSWTAIFAKAYAIVADDIPELRRAYVKWPWAHLVEYSSSVAAITFERDFEGERAVLIGRVKSPECISLLGLTELIRVFREEPVMERKDFRRALRVAGWPRPIRRAAWWYGLNSSRQRVRFFGTFGVSVYSALGAESLHPLTPLTAVLNYGVISADGLVDVRLTYDHRVMDGSTVARALQRLEEVLTSSIVSELRPLHVTPRLAA